MATKQLPSLVMAVHNKFTNDEQIRLRFKESNSFKYKHLGAVKMWSFTALACDKLVFPNGGLVFILQRPIVLTHGQKES